MPSFRYVAITPSGAMTKGDMDAPDVATVVQRLRSRGNIPMRAELARQSRLAGVSGWPALGRGLRRQEVADFTRELAIMLDAGQDLDRALRFLIETNRTPRVVRILGRIRDAVRDGAAFAAALADHPASFSRLYVGLIRAGEAGGALAATLERLAVLLERERALASTVTSALIYPGLLLLAAVGSVALLLTSVLPQFVPLFEESGAKLPASTRMMIAAGDIVSDWGPWVLAGSVPLLFAASRLLRRPAPRLFIDRLLLRLPVVGPLAREVLAARLTRTLGTLLVNGMPLVEALDVVRDALGNAAGAAAVEAATRDTREGAGLAGPLAATGLFPPRTTYLLQLGEETAKLGAMALRAADIHEEKTRLAVQRLVSLLTPAITIGMGAVIAAIVSSLLQAMLGLNDLVQ